MRIINKIKDNINNIEDVYLKSFLQIIFYPLVYGIAITLYIFVALLIYTLYQKILWLGIILTIIGIYIFLVYRNKKGMKEKKWI